MAKGTQRKGKATNHGLCAIFEDKYGVEYKITLISFILSFYRDDELIKTLDVKYDEIKDFTKSVYKITDYQKIKKNEIKFSEI